jgi:hypothetical protein
MTFPSSWLMSLREMKELIWDFDSYFPFSFPFHLISVSASISLTVSSILFSAFPPFQSALLLSLMLPLANVQRCDATTTQILFPLQSLLIRNAVLLDLKPCSSCKNRRFGGTYLFHYQGEKILRARKNVGSNLRLVSVTSFDRYY